MIMSNPPTRAKSIIWLKDGRFLPFMPLSLLLNDKSIATSKAFGFLIMNFFHAEKKDS
jgi:hypothetical protein